MADANGLGDRPTPAAVVDLEVLERNCERMRARARSFGVRLRPHVKTHSTVEGARLQVAAPAGPVTVATLAQARALADAGFDDILWAVPVSAARLREAFDLAGRVRLGLLVDGEPAAAALTRATAGSERRLRVHLKLDLGSGQSGVDPTRVESARLAAELSRAPGLDFRGVLAHAGHSYACRSRSELEAVAERERAVPVAFAERLRRDGLRVDEVSIGSTPTLAVASDLSGVTEIRPGNYVFHDAFQLAHGSCRAEDLAFSVLASVIGTHPDRVVLDAGALALSRDPGAAHLEDEPGFGLLCDLRGRRLSGWRLRSLSQEHGVARPVAESGAEPAPAPGWGERLRVVPNHSCLAAAGHDHLLVVRAGEVVDRWPTIRGW